MFAKILAWGGSLIGHFSMNWPLYAGIASYLALAGTVYVQHLKIEALDGKNSALSEKLTEAGRINGEQKTTIDGLTEEKKAAEKRAADSDAKLIIANAAVAAKIAKIKKEIAHVSSPLDNAPAVPSQRAALRGLLKQFGPKNDQ